jgi:hypothetical protein
MATSFQDCITDLLPDGGPTKADQAPGLFVPGSGSVPLQSRVIKATVHPEGFCETTEEFAFVSDRDVRWAVAPWVKPTCRAVQFLCGCMHKGDLRQRIWPSPLCSVQCHLQVPVATSLCCVQAGGPHW